MLEFVIKNFLLLLRILVFKLFFILNYLVFENIGFDNGLKMVVNMIVFVGDIIMGFVMKIIFFVIKERNKFLSFKRVFKKRRFGFWL